MQRWFLYRLANFTRKEVYFAVSTEPRDRIVAHCAGIAKAIGHWNRSADPVSVQLLKSFPTQEEAAIHAHALERTPDTPGWTIIPTAA